MKTHKDTQTDVETLSTRDAADRLQVSIRAVQMWVAQGRLNAWKTPGGHGRIFKSSIDAMCAAGSGKRSDITNGRKIEPINPPETTDTTDTADPIDRQEIFDMLVVGDESLHLALNALYANFPGSKIKVRFIQNPLESLIKIGEAPPDLLVADVVTPHADGFEILNAINRLASRVAMKVIVTTAMTEQQIIESGGFAGQVECHKKPIVPAQLLKSISAHIDTWKQRRSRS